MEEYNRLPISFSEGPHNYLEFLRRWGRFVVRGANYGGSIKLIMTYTQSAKSAASESASSWSAAVSAKFDSITAGGSAKVSGGMSEAKSATEKKMEDSSKVSLECSGGDPAIAAVVSDFQPGPDSAATFRNDLQMWLPSVAKFPALVTDLPRLEFLHSILPMSTNEERFRRHAISHAESVISTDPWLAMHPTDLQCSGQGWRSLSEPEGGPDFEYDDFNRMRPGYCLSLRAKTAGALYLSLSGVPTQKDGKVLLTIGTEQTTLDVWQRDKAKSSPTRIEGEWHNLLRTVEPATLAVGSRQLVGDYWICLDNSHEGGDPVTEVTFGIGRSQVVKKLLDPRIHPSYFAIGCQNNAAINGITITPFASFQEYIAEKLEVASVCPRIVGCADTDVPLVEDGCFCSACIAEVYEPQRDNDGKIESCLNVGCQPGGNDVISDCHQYEEKLIGSAEDCSCTKCDANFLLDPTANMCSQCDTVDGCEQYDTSSGECECYKCEAMEGCVSFEALGPIDDPFYKNCKTCKTCLRGLAGAECENVNSHPFSCS
jgi:hypothetical protein